MLVEAFNWQPVFALHTGHDHVTVQALSQQHMVPQLGCLCASPKTSSQLVPCSDRSSGKLEGIHTQVFNPLGSVCMFVCGRQLPVCVLRVLQYNSRQFILGSCMLSFIHYCYPF